MGRRVNRPSEADQANSRLRAGLETCRSMIANYRTLLTQDEGQAVEQQPQPVGDDEPERLKTPADD
jgi:hypothetical protein